MNQNEGTETAPIECDDCNEATDRSRRQERPIYCRIDGETCKAYPSGLILFNDDEGYYE